MDKTWSRFWDGQVVFSDFTLEKNMCKFVGQVEPLIQFKNDDHVLDIGCGPGQLPKLISKRVQEMHCLDTSKTYIKQNKENLNYLKNVHFYELDHENYLNFDFLNDLKFSLIIVSTIIQYYNSMDDVRNLLENIIKYAKPGARAIITDLPFKNNLLSEVRSQFIEGIRQKYLSTVLLTFLKARFSEYYSLREKLLVINPDEMESMLNELNLNYRFIDTELTVNKGRRHLLLNF